MNDLDTLYQHDQLNLQMLAVSDPGGDGTGVKAMTVYRAKSLYTRGEFSPTILSPQLPSHQLTSTITEPMIMIPLKKPGYQPGAIVCYAKATV